MNDQDDDWENNGSLYLIDVSEFVDLSQCSGCTTDDTDVTGIDTTGYVYAPTGCLDTGSSCDVAFFFPGGGSWVVGAIEYGIT